jgi:hypothetical protein
MGPAGPAGPNMISAVGTIVTDALATKVGEKHVLSITDAAIKATSLVWVSVKNGSNTQGSPVVVSVTPLDGSALVEIMNLDKKDDLNGTLQIALMVINA